MVHLEEVGPLLFWLQQAHQTLKLAISHAYKLMGHEVSTEQFSVLSYLHAQRGASQIEIARATRREKASVSRILSGLEKNGLVTRSSIDMRTNRVELTETGKAIYALLSPIGNEIGGKVLGEIPRDEVDATIRLLKRIAEHKIGIGSS